MPGYVARIQEGRSSLEILKDTLTGKRLLERPRPRWEENIRMGLQEMGINTRNWIDSAKNRDYWGVLVNEPQVP